MTPRVALYARISEDSTGKAHGVERQLHDAAALCAARGWEIVGRYSDNNISALRGKHRPGYSSMLEAVKRREFDAIVVFQMSRLWRNRSERARDIDAFAAAKVNIVAVQGTDLDLATASGRAVAGLLGEMDTLESEIKSERVLAAAAHRARQGRPNGPLGYGWKRVGDQYEVVPHEADIVREIVRRLGEREPLLAVTADLNKRGVPAPKSPTWGKTSVKKIAIRPSNVALLVRHRDRDDEALLEGTWPSLIDRAEWDRVREILTSPGRQTNGATRPGARKHLLTFGVGVCGVCGTRLRVALKGNSRWGTKKRLYVCDADGCVGRQQESVDDLVRGVVVARLSRPDALDWLLGDEEAAKAADARARDLRGRLDDAADRFADGGITGDQLERITARLTPEIAAAEAERAKHAGSRDLEALAALAGPGAAERWDAMSVVQRRAVLQALDVMVVIDKVKRRGPGFDPECVRFVWNSAS